jgi:hypothetical protein
MLQVPPAWNSSKRQKTNRARSESVRKKTRWVYEQAEPVSLEELCRGICQTISDANPKEWERERAEETLSFSTILSHVPYQKILETLLGSEPAPTAQVPVITKAYEESFIREPIYQGERKCVMGAECECHFIDRDNPFTGIELLLPGQSASDVTPQMCVLCSRKHTQKMFYDMLYRPPATHVGTIQRYGVLVSVPKEYSPDFVLIMPPHGPVHCMPYPSPAHSRNGYAVQMRAGARYLVQKPEAGFRPPSLDSASNA